jgi:hypothetical protein
MTEPIRLHESSEVSDPGVGMRDATELRLDPSRRVMLRFQVLLDGEDAMEALRYARRAMIREERTRGLEWDEPSMEDPTLAGSEIRWFCLASQAAWCRQKMAELIERANRAAEEIKNGGASGSSDRYHR